jgi:hypothetical protein
MNRVDREALQRALKLARAEPEYCEQLERKAAAECWEKAAQFASYCLQIDNLGLRPWMDPPCYAEVRPDAEALKILLKLLGAGLSRYEPDPIAALAEARVGSHVARDGQ